MRFVGVLFSPFLAGGKGGGAGRFFCVFLFCFVFP